MKTIHAYCDDTCGNSLSTSSVGTVIWILVQRITKAMFVSHAHTDTARTHLFRHHTADLIPNRELLWDYHMPLV